MSIQGSETHNKWDFLQPQKRSFGNFFQQTVDNNKTAYYFGGQLVHFMFF
jgi:hypothetical protein